MTSNENDILAKFCFPGMKPITMPNTNYDFSEAIDKATALDTLISDIRNGVVKIVFCNPTMEMQDKGNGAIKDYVLVEPKYVVYCAPIYKAMLSAAPDYEPLKKFMEE